MLYCTWCVCDIMVYWILNVSPWPTSEDMFHSCASQNTPKTSDLDTQAIAIAIFGNVRCFLLYVIHFLCHEFQFVLKPIQLGLSGIHSYTIRSSLYWQGERTSWKRKEGKACPTTRAARHLKEPAFSVCPLTDYMAVFMPQMLSYIVFDLNRRGGGGVDDR